MDLGLQFTPIGAMPSLPETGPAWAIMLAFQLLLLVGFIGWLDELLGSADRRRSELRRLQARQIELEQQLTRLQELLRRSAVLTSMLSTERVLDTALDLGASAVTDAENGGARLVRALLLFTPDHERLYVESGRGLIHSDFRVELPGSSGALERAVTTCEPQLLDNPLEDPELRHLTGLHACREAVCLPLAIGLEVYGVLLFAHPEPGFFSPEQLDLLDVIAQQARVALQNARLYRDLELEKERMMEIQEEARNKLARDLHDGPTQSVGALGMRVNFARRLMERDPKAAAEELYKIEELARRTTKEIRQMLFTLRPLILESEGLVTALQHLAEKTRETHTQNVQIQADPSAVEDMEVGKQGVVFYIVEEAVNNARKHAQAEHIWVRLLRQGDLVLVEIEDDGVGFDVRGVEENYDQRGSLGMVNLRERTELVSGILKIDSEPGRGTKVQVVVPLTIEAAERLQRPGFSV